MSSVLIFHHLGLGDHIMCHGIVREYAKKYQKVGLFCLPHNYASVSFMYHDLKHLVVLKADNDIARKFIKENKAKNGPEKYDEILILGFEKLTWKGPEKLEEQFYRIAGVPLSKIWDSFYVERDLKKEQAVFDAYAPKEKYIFLHEDPARNFRLNRKLITSKYPIFMPDAKIAENFFDYCTVIEKAAEIHVMDSCFMFLIDCLPYKNPDQKLFVHQYARNEESWKFPILKKDWKILTDKDIVKSPSDHIRDAYYKNELVVSKLYKRAIRKLKKMYAM